MLPPLNALVERHQNDMDLRGAQKMIDYVLNNPVLMRNDVSRRKFLEQMRDELAQLYDAAFAGVTAPTLLESSVVYDAVDSSNADAMAKIEAQLVAEFVKKHKGNVVQIADAETWTRLKNVVTPERASSGTYTIVFKGNSPTVFFQKPDNATPLGETMRYVQESQRFRGESPTYNKYVKEFAGEKEEENIEFLSSFTFPQYASLAHDGEKNIKAGPVFLQYLPSDLKYVTIFPFDQHAYDLVNKYKNEFGYTPDIIARASFKTRKDDVPQNLLALNYLLGIEDGRPFADFVFYNV